MEGLSAATDGGTLLFSMEQLNFTQSTLLKPFIAIPEWMIDVKSVKFAGTLSYPVHRNQRRSVTLNAIRICYFHRSARILKLSLYQRMGPGMSFRSIACARGSSLKHSQANLPFFLKFKERNRNILQGCSKPAFRSVRKNAHHFDFSCGRHPRTDRIRVHKLLAILPSQECGRALVLLHAADYFGIAPLESEIETMFMDKFSVDKDNVAGILELCAEKEELTSLRRKYFRLCLRTRVIRR
ncbi:hypothetical protein BJ742DRAFT_802049 [Cladochytrium replicatum]|nr:hypothetical protein BJ742DRAFT_802049 [Cladochytrium replicatum]